MKKDLKSGTKDQEYALVYSTDRPQESRCSGCRQALSACACPASKVEFTAKPSYRIERKGRGGKTVTVISNLPAHDTFLKDLSAFLKRSVGSGGTHYVEAGVGSIEIQGERIDELPALVEKYRNR